MDPLRRRVGGDLCVFRGIVAQQFPRGGAGRSGLRPKSCAGKNCIFPLPVPGAGKPVRKAVLQCRQREKRVYACVQERMERGIVR